mmetsp:Transcript_153325/g.489900  ORF Transcript_153325/g.489900 Transcript_153325/m.489900 type:complete len:433 (+) Transcript_153325:99-1397(+)
MSRRPPVQLGGAARQRRSSWALGGGAVALALFWPLAPLGFASSKEGGADPPRFFEVRLPPLRGRAFAALWPGRQEWAPRLPGHAAEGRWAPRPARATDWGQTAACCAVGRPSSGRRAGMASARGLKRPASGAQTAMAAEVHDKVFLVTGATDGIGKFTAERLAQIGAVVLVHGRKEARVQRTVEEISERTGSKKVQGCIADLSLMKDVRALAAEVSGKFPVIHGLMNNAGTFDGDYTGKRVVTSEGNEYSLAVNVMAPFLLTSLLLKNVQASGEGRVVIMSSMSAGYSQGLSDLQLEKSYSAHDAYSLSKLCDAMIAMELHGRYGDPPKLCIHTLDPDPTSSWIDTKMLRAGWSSGGHPVSRATASFQMLTEAKYGKSSGARWGCSGGGSRAQQDKLWSDLVALTGAEWPPVAGAGAGEEQEGEGGRRVRRQ